LRSRRVRRTRRRAGRDTRHGARPSPRDGRPHVGVTGATCRVAYGHRQVAVVIVLCSDFFDPFGPTTSRTTSCGSGSHFTGTLTFPTAADCRTVGRPSTKIVALLTLLATYETLTSVLSCPPHDTDVGTSNLLITAPLPDSARDGGGRRVVRAPSDPEHATSAAAAKTARHIDVATRAQAVRVVMTRLLLSTGAGRDPRPA